MMSGRKSDASIAFSVTDNLSQSIVGMKNSVNSFRADVTGLQERLDALDHTRAVSYTHLDVYKRQVMEAHARRTGAHSHTPGAVSRSSSTWAALFSFPASM